MAEPEFLSNVGNFEDYTHIPRRALPNGIIYEPQLALKWYNMIEKGERRFSDKRAKSFVENQIRNSRIGPSSGLGFVILSDKGKMINVARWDIQIPYLLQNTVYDNEKVLDTRIDGAFCVWELGIVNHEKEAWKKYLASPRKFIDKIRYLADFKEGEL